VAPTAVLRDDGLAAPGALGRGGARHRRKPRARSGMALGFARAGAIRLLLLTGCRRGEILHARWGDVDTERGVLHLRDAKTGPRDVVLNAPAIEALRSLPRDGEWIVPRHVAHTPIRLDRVWRRVRARASLEDVRLHDLRHCYASVAVGAGVPLYTVGGLLDHSLPSTTARYAHLADDPLRRATELVGARIAAGLEGKPDAEVVPLRDRG